VPDKIHTIRPDTGIQFTNRQRDQDAFHHRLERVCRDESLDPRLTKTHHPWTNGQGERLNRPRKEATMQKYDDQTPQHIRAHLQAFLMADNFAKRRKPLKGRTPSEYICQCWHTEPERFRINPHHHTLGLNT
jgi:transposase InsO family protein